MGFISPIMSTLKYAFIWLKRKAQRKLAETEPIVSSQPLDYRAADPDLRRHRTESGTNVLTAHAHLELIVDVYYK